MSLHEYRDFIASKAVSAKMQGMTHKPTFPHPETSAKVEHSRSTPAPCAADHRPAHEAGVPYPKRTSRARVAPAAVSSLSGGGRVIRIAAILGLLASPIAAQQCGDRSVIVAALAERYNESHRFVGLTSGGQMIEAFAAPSGSWTILLSSPNGTSCVVSVGELFEVIAPPPEGVPG